MGTPKLQLPGNFGLGLDGDSVTVISVSESTEDGGSNVVTFNDGTTLTIKNGNKGASVAVKSVSESTEDGGSNVITFSDGTTLTIKNGSEGSPGTSITVASISESAVDGGSNIVTFSDGKTLSVKNGKTGASGYTPVKGVDYYTDEDKSEYSEYIASELAKRGQLKPEFANSIEECTDTTKLYVLPDRYIYAYMLTDAEPVPTYTNQLPKAIDTDGSIYNGTGYKTGYRLSSSGVESEQADAAITGYIPCKQGDLLRLKGITKHGSSNYVLSYSSAFVKYGALLYGSNIVDAGDGIYTIDTSSLNADTAYVRLSIGTISSDAIVTVNEEITESGGGTEYAWANTGHAFPTDYEDRIIDLEEASAEHTEQIAALEKAVATGGIDETELQALSRIKYWDKPVFDSAPVTLLSDDRAKPTLTDNDRTIDAIYSAYRSLMAQYPIYITETNLGPCTSSDTFEAIDMLRFDFREPDGRTNTGYDVYETKPKLIFMTGVHNEWAGVWAVYYALEEITTNPAFADIRRNTHIIVIPCANPYGLVKPLGEYETPSHVNANGVAIHNNFGVEHNSNIEVVGSYNYGGTTPYSELETQYIDAVMAENADAVAFVSCHNCDYDTEHGIGVIWASSATAYMCNITFRLIDKLTNAWLDKYGDALISAIENYKTDAVSDGDYRLGKAQFSFSAGTEQKNATKYGIQGVNVEIPRMMKVFSGDTDSSSEVMTHGAEVYTNLMRTILMAHDHKDKKEYAPNLPWDA